MIKPLEWPCFAKRSDCMLDLSQRQTGKILRQYASGFDGELSDNLIFFTVDYASLHPSAILIPAMVPEMVSEGQSLTLDADCLQISPHQFLCSADISVCSRPIAPDLELLHENLLSLLSNLKLFGRASIVLPLVTGCQTSENALSAAEKLLLEPCLDLNRLVQFVGAGEGLTPAFDDFLSGMLFADRFLGIRQIEFPAEFSGLIRHRTTRQAVQQLEFASQGALSIRFEEFLLGMATRRVKAHEIVKMLNWGHTSGTDILCGIWYYLSQKVKI